VTRVLVVSPHPDDESIGCGGTLRRHVVRGDDVHVIHLTSGEQGGDGRPPHETARIRETEAEAAAAVLGLTQFEFWRQPDGAIRATKHLVEQLRGSIERFRPRIIYVTHAREMHPDHRAAVRLVRQSLSGLRSQTRAPRVLTFEVWTPMQDMDEIVDISPYIETKMQAIRAHRSQCDIMRFDDAALGLARYRGEMHLWPGGDYAEIFCELRPRS